MKLYSLIKLLVSGTLIAALSYLSFLPIGASVNYLKPKNIIIMISDGCGYNQIDTTSFYQYGKTGKQVYEKFPIKLGMSTYSVFGSYDINKAWTDFSYVNNLPTDSAAASTAMSTGIKTYDAGIGVDIDGKPIKNILETVEELGKSTGVVTTVEFSHATPAGFVAHNANRNNYEEIAKEMILFSKIDVIMGAGNPWYNDNGQKLSAAQLYEYVGGEATWDGLLNGSLNTSDADGDGISDKWTLIQTREEFKKLSKGKTPKRLIGVPQVATTLQQARSGDDKANPYVVPQNTDVPNLSEMTSGALNVLDNNKKGFFLMIEGGAIDWAGHADQSGRLIEEEIDFNKSVESVVNWINKSSSWKETLLIVTSDHETGYLAGPGSNPTWQEVVNNGKGNMPGFVWNSTSHTNNLVPIFAKGVGVNILASYANQTDLRRGRYIDNTEIAKTVFKLLE